MNVQIHNREVRRYMTFFITIIKDYYPEGARGREARGGCYGREHTFGIFLS